MKPRRIVSGLCLAALVLPFALAGIPASAKANDKIVREAIISTLGADGAVVKTNIAQLIHLDAAANGGKDVELRVPKVGELRSYRNLSGFRNPSGEGNDFVWRTGGKLDAAALARFDGRLPIAVRVRYSLDGKEVSADEIKRQDGKVRIEIDIENVSGESRTLEYKAATSPFLTSVVNQYIPFQYQVRAEFPVDRWSQVGGQGVHVSTESGKEIASASGVLSPPLTAASQTIALEAESDDVLTPRIQVFAFPGISQSFLDSMQEQFEALSALYGGVGSVSENLGKIYAGAIEIESGVEELLEGVGERDEDSKQPVVDLGDDGAPTTLLGAIGFISEQITEKVLPSLGARDPATGKGIVTKDEKGNLDPETLIAGLQSQKDAYDEDLIPNMDELIAGVEDLQGGLEGLWEGLHSQEPGEPGLREGLQEISGGLGQVIGGLQSGNPADPGAIEALTLVSQGLTELFLNLDKVPDPVNPLDYGFRESLLAINAAAEAGLAACLAVPLVSCGPADAGGAIATAFGTINAFVDGLTAAVGSRNAGTGAPNLVFDNPACAPACPADAVTALAVMMAIIDGNAALGIDPGVIDGLMQAVGGLGLMRDALDDEILPGIGARGADGDPIITLDGSGTPTTLIGALGFMHGALGMIRNTGLSNPEWTEEQAALDGKTPKEYFEECPACFDPDTDVFDEATVGLGPGFRDVFVLFSEGIEAALPELHSFEESSPGLVDGLQKIADGLDELAEGLHTFDPDDPGLVDGLELLRSGVQQVGQGLFAVDELGLRTIKGQVGETADGVARDRASLADRAESAARESVLATGADIASATYVFDLPAQQTAAQDNVVRGGLVVGVLGGMTLLARRMRRFDV